LAAVNQELEAFSYSVSHDLRAPLRSIDGFAHALLEDYAASLDEDGQEYLRHVREAAQHMGELIDGLLTLAGVTRSQLRREAVNLSQLARDVGKRLQNHSSDLGAPKPERKGNGTSGSRVSASSCRRVARTERCSAPSRSA
jgi:light-regulated signal transduction histidine kinase (bacteriophytochrome)